MLKLSQEKIIALAKLGKIRDENGAEIRPNAPLNRPLTVVAPSADNVEPAPESDVAKALKLVATATIEAQKLYTSASNEQVAVMVATLNALKRVLETKPQVKEKEKILEVWEFVFKKNAEGKIIGSTAIQTEGN